MTDKEDKLRKLAGPKNVELGRFPLPDPDSDSDDREYLDEDRAWVELRQPVGIEHDEIRSQVVREKTVASGRFADEDTFQQETIRESQVSPAVLKAAELGIITDARIPHVTEDGDLEIYEWAENDKTNVRWLRDHGYAPLFASLFLVILDNVILTQTEDVVREGEASHEKSDTTPKPPDTGEEPT